MNKELYLSISSDLNNYYQRLEDLQKESLLQNELKKIKKRLDNLEYENLSWWEKIGIIPPWERWD